MTSNLPKINDLITNLHNAKNDNDKFAGCLYVSYT